MPIIKYTDKGFLLEHPFIFGDPAQTHSYIFSGDELVLFHGITLPDDAQVANISSIQLISAKCSLIAQKPNIFSEEFSRVFQATRSFELDSFSLAINNSNAKNVPWNSGADGYAPNLNYQQDRNWKLPSGDFRREINFFTDHTNGILKWTYWFYFPLLFRWEYWFSRLAPQFSDDDFWVNNPATQDGQNNFWFHYFIANKWLIMSRLTLELLVNGLPITVRNDLNLTPGTDDINDYSSNTDFINKSIKTVAIGGTPSNTPALIYGFQDTEVWSYFEKVSAWGGNEQGNIVAVCWIEPFEGGGITQRTRGSSWYPITPESVFKGLNTSITDDDGTSIVTGNGEYIIKDANGVGALVLFNGLLPQTFKVYAQIDYAKLVSTYPGQRKFTLYTRLYNITKVLSESQTTIAYAFAPFVYLYGYNNALSGKTYTAGYVLGNTGAGNYRITFPSDWLITITDPSATRINHYTYIVTGPLGNINIDATPGSSGNITIFDTDAAQTVITFPVLIDVLSNNCVKGEEIKQDLILIPTQFQNGCNDLLCAQIQRGCPFDLDVFADVADSNDLKNDKSDFYLQGDASVASIVMTLQKNDSSCADGNWIDKAIITTSNYGKFFAYGFSNDFSNIPFIDDYGKRYTGLFLEWRTILNTFGIGVYRMKIDTTDIQGNTITCYDQRIFCLKAWNCNLINGTVRLEMKNVGFRGSYEDRDTQIDYQGGWNGQIRLKGFMTEDNKPDYLEERTQYGASSSFFEKPYIDELHPKYNLDIRDIPGWVDRYLKNYFLLSDEMYVTDFNSNNINRIEKLAVRKNGGFESKRQSYAATERVSSCLITLFDAKNNLRKTNSQ